MYRCSLIIINYQRQLAVPINILGIKKFSSEKLVSNLKKSKIGKNKLLSLVSDMNLEKKVQETSMPKMVKKKIKFKDSTNLSVIKAHVIGTGAIGSPKAFFVVTDNGSYMFNCGEMTQRMSLQLKLRLSKLENVFITKSVWENIGGLPGMSLTRQEMKAECLNIHGPPGVGKIFESTKMFITLKHMQVNIFETAHGGNFNDGILDIKYVPLFPSEENQAPSNPYFIKDSSDDTEKFDEEEDLEAGLNIDYYDYSQGPSDENSSPPITAEGSRVVIEEDDISKKPSICYVCKTPDILGKLNLEACAEFNVPPGPLYGRLKKKEDVKLPDGSTIYYKDVTYPDVPGKIFLVVDCPGHEYLDSLLNEPTFKSFQNEKNPADTPVLIVHFTPPSVMNDPKYVEWMKKFPKTAHHLRLNEDNIDVGTPPLHRLQTKLNLIHQEIFPVMPNPAIPVIKSSEKLKTADPSVENSLQDIAMNFDKFFYDAMKQELIEHETKAKEEKLVETNVNTEKDVLEGRTLLTIDLKNFKIEKDPSFALWPEEYIQEAFQEDGAAEAVRELKQELKKIEPEINSSTEDYPKFLFLGTGSSCPQSIRNTSGILVFINEDTCLLLDCGEGTCNQLILFFGKEKAEEILLKLKAVYISHMHADHHLGFLGILKGRRRAIENYVNKIKRDNLPEFENLSNAEIVSKLNIKPIHLLAPNSIKMYLKLYNSLFEEILSDFSWISNGILKVLFYLHKDEVSYFSKKKRIRAVPPPERVVEFLKELHLKEFKTIHVRHCFDAFGASFVTDNDCKVTYSGDCMPSGNLVEIGRNSDILIHEATMDNDRKPDAARKLHSTTDQAVAVGKEMKAKFTLLTHFSQRYVYLPRCTEIFSENVGIAFDMMMVSKKQLPLLPKFMPAFRLIFAEKLRELDGKSYKAENMERRNRVARALKRKAEDASEERLKLKSY